MHLMHIACEAYGSGGSCDSHSGGHPLVTALTLQLHEANS